MRTDQQFLVITFIIIVAVLLTAANITEAVLAISLLTNFFVISTYFGKMFGVAPAPTEPKTQQPPPEKPQIAESASPKAEGPDHGPFYGAWDAYRMQTEPIPQPHIAVSASERAYGIDSANALMAQRRARDKRCIDGAVSKTADYYKYHYGPELDREAVKEWWGAGEW